MKSDSFWIASTALASALCWWPVVMEPNLDLPWWLPLTVIAVCVGFASSLSFSPCRHFVAASAVGTFAGIWTGYRIWWPPDGIPVYVQSVQATVVLNTLAAALISLVAALTARRVAVSNKNRRRAVWIALVASLAFGPIATAFTPLLVAYRVKRNDRLAADRFEALKRTVEQMSEAGNRARICDGLALQRIYSGPPFSEADWHRITGNYVREDGYVFMVYCREQAGYTIAAMPARGKADGTRCFCTDESRKLTCGMAWNLSRHACIACPK